MHILKSLILLNISALVLAGPTPEPGDTALTLAQKSLADGTCKTIEYRKEWMALTKEEKAAYLKAVKCLSNKPHSPKLRQQFFGPGLLNLTTDSSFYDDMVYIHVQQTKIIHNTGLFFPWHRWYIQEHLNQLREQCGYKGVLPYWDWSRDAADFEHSPLFDPDSTSGFGTWGDQNDDWRVKDGALSTFKLAYPSKHYLRRQFKLYPYIGSPFAAYPNQPGNATITYDNINDAIENYDGDFIGFQNVTEAAQGFHGSVHLMHGGDMGGTCPKNAPSSCSGGPTFSSNDPTFFLHHANIDRIWALWQLHDPVKNFFAFEGGSVQAFNNPTHPNGLPPWLTMSATLPTNGLFPEKTVEDMINFVGGDLCYIYV